MSSATPPISSARYNRWRTIKDVMMRHAMAVGGIAVIITLLLIFFYLLYVVLPLFASARLEAGGTFAAPGSAAATLYVDMEEQAEVGVRFTADAAVTFFQVHDGKVIAQEKPALPAGVTATSFAVAATPGTVVLGLSDGRALVLQHHYSMTFVNNQRTITPRLDYPLGHDPIVIDAKGSALTQLALQSGDAGSTFVAATQDGRLLLTRLEQHKSLLDDEAKLELSNAVLSELPEHYTYLLLDPDARRIYAADANGDISHYDVTDHAAPRLIERIRVTVGSERITAMSFLSGGVSLLIGTSSGRIAQWFAVRDANNRYALAKVREFTEQHAAIAGFAAERARKGFIAVDAAGAVGVYNATAHRTLLVKNISGASPLRHVALGPRDNALLAEDAQGKLRFWRITNPHPEISWSSLWGKVWYEGYDQPKYVWQSSAANNDAEPKFSLTPLVFGTLKAAAFAMIIAVPLAIMGAIYTAYFMAPRMRRIVKPSIEIMEALPTVILGFLAGLWLAPYLEEHLPGVFAMVLVMPLGVLGFALLWQNQRNGLRHRVPEGWLSVLLIPVLLLLGWISLSLSIPMEQWWFGGDMRVWLATEMGIKFDQRNALIVGLAMGIAAVPPIFSIAEDAIFSVPRHLTNGSLALGATPWQTLVRVVLLTASPGIFSGIMIGLGRTVGETMIVLMATGNTPIMDMSIFQGMRTLSANIAVEMPESAVNSTHFRVLFLAALVLFMFTFVLNTVAEIVRQRLRKQYGSL